MARVVIIGGSGHVGTYLVPRLVEAGFEVVNVSRGKREPYSPHAAWSSVRTVELDREKVNVNGGAMALGHPIGATGSILIGTIIDELERRDLKRGLVTMCAAGGMAPAIIVERV